MAGFTIASPSNVVTEDGQLIYIGVGVYRTKDPVLAAFLRSHPALTEVDDLEPVAVEVEAEGQPAETATQPELDGL
jgi:hypothetical protein